MSRTVPRRRATTKPNHAPDRTEKSFQAVDKLQQQTIEEETLPSKVEASLAKKTTKQIQVPPCKPDKPGGKGNQRGSVKTQPVVAGKVEKATRKNGTRAGGKELAKAVDNKVTEDVQQQSATVEKHDEPRTDGNKRGTRKRTVKAAPVEKDGEPPADGKKTRTAKQAVKAATVEKIEEPSANGNKKGTVKAATVDKLEKPSAGGNKKGTVKRTVTAATIDKLEEPSEGGNKKGTVKPTVKEATVEKYAEPPADGDRNGAEKRSVKAATVDKLEEPPASSTKKGTVKKSLAHKDILSLLESGNNWKIFFSLIDLLLLRVNLSL
jgi:hypothetical protein